MDLLHTHTQCCLGQDLFTNMKHNVTLTFRWPWYSILFFNYLC